MPEKTAMAYRSDPEPKLGLPQSGQLPPEEYEWANKVARVLRLPAKYVEENIKSGKFIKDGELDYDVILSDVLGIVTPGGKMAGASKVVGKTAMAKESGIVDAIRSMQRPGQERELVSISKLRDKMGGVEEFDDQIIRLAKEGKVALHKHDFPYGLKPEERAKLLSVDDPLEYKGKAFYGALVPKAGMWEKSKP